MLAIPLIPPQEDQSSFLRTAYRPRAESPPPGSVQTQQQNHRERQRRDEERKLHHARSPLALLAADEAAIEQRKAAVRNFGAQWIRPPGVAKTLQAMREEEQERQDQAELERQERNMMDIQAQQQLAEAQQEAANHDQDEGDGEEERDLDAEIPDADADAEATTVDVTFNEDSIMEGSHVQSPEGGDPDLDVDLEEAELTGAARDEEDLGIGMERNLDDSVPEAGSYQHTDTELEDSDSDSSSEIVSFVGRSASQQPGTAADRSGMEPPPMTGLQNRMRAQVTAPDALPRSPGSLNLSSSVLDSSMATSSPVAQRSNVGGRTRGGQRGRRGRHD